MKIPMYQIDAFSTRVFGGNPAAVCLLDGWPSDRLLQLIAAENNLSETAFVGRDENGYQIRWFTPQSEVDLCGHATLAAGFVMMNEMFPDMDTINFSSKSGPLAVAKDGDYYVLNFPNWMPERQSIDLSHTSRNRSYIIETWKYRDYIIVLDSEDAVRGFEPHFEHIAKLDALGLIVTAPGNDADFVSRFFAPAVGVPEDPVTGSAHSELAPLWQSKLQKDHFFARQLSQRGGELSCRVAGDRVYIGGHAAVYFKGEIRV
jgi:PhzF family phenazine biosynthesis protein